MPDSYVDGVCGILFRRSDTGDLEVLVVTEDHDDPRTGKKAGTVSLPAGWVDSEETPEEAIIREFLEETGYLVRPIASAGMFSVNGSKKLKAFFMEMMSAEIREPVESMDPRWLSVEQLLSMRDEEVRPPVKEILQSLALPASSGLWVPSHVLA